MMTTKREFIEKVTILCDTREQKNQHIINELDSMGVKHENIKLDFGDYSFRIDNKDFSMSCIIERKGNINELWGNITKERKRFEKELQTARSVANSVNLLIENCQDWNSLRVYKVSDEEMERHHRKVKNIGEVIYSTLKSWSSGNRYGFNVNFAEISEHSAKLILDVFYWYWHNYRELLKPLRK